MKSRLVALCTALALSPMAFATVISGTSASGVLDSVSPTIVSLNLPASCFAPAPLTASWSVTDSHPGPAGLTLTRLSDQVEVQSWLVSHTGTPQVGWNQAEIGLFEFQFITWDALGNQSGSSSLLAVTPPPCTPGSELSTTLLDFGTVVSMAPLSLQFSLTNTAQGSCPDAVSGTIEETCPTFSVSPASYSLAQGDSVTVTVTFTGDHSGPTTCDVVTSHGTVSCVVSDLVSADEGALAFTLSAPHPNPFNPLTTLRYSLPETGLASLRVYDLAGGLRATLLEGLQAAGTHEVQVDAGAWASGLYMAVLEANGRQQVQKLILSK